MKILCRQLSLRFTTSRRGGRAGSPVTACGEPRKPQTVVPHLNSKNTTIVHHSQVLIRILRARPLEPRLGAEIGVQSGNTSEALLRAFPRLTLYMIDPWSVPQPDSSFALSGDPVAREPAEKWGEMHRRATSRIRFAGNRAVILRQTAVEAAGRIDDASLDFAFVDGDHSHTGVLRDAQTYWQKVRPGGILFFHDYDSPAEWCFGVKPAVDEFAASVSREVIREEKTVAWISR